MSPTAAADAAPATPHATPAAEDATAAAGEPIPAEPAAQRAREAGVEAARARENNPRMVDEVELRVGDEYLSEHQVQVVMRVPLTRPGEVRAQREIYAAETEMAMSRLEQAQLTRRSDICFPSVEAEARSAEAAIFEAYAERQERLLAYNDEVRRGGLVNEIDASRFELAGRLRLETRVPPPVPPRAEVIAALPALVAPAGSLERSEETLRQAVSTHHPSVALRQATAARFEAMADRARSRSRPWIKFVDLSYEYRSGRDRSGRSVPSRNGGGGRVAFTVPLGGSEKANERRYLALQREQAGEADAFVDEQIWRGMRALELLNAFETRAERLLDLLVLAQDAEAVADRWWQSKLATPGQVAGLLDEAFDARTAVLDAREDAGVARCTLLAMTGVAAEEWPRDSGRELATTPLEATPDTGASNTGASR